MYSDKSLVGYLSVSTLGWYCVRTQPKREHFAAAHLKMVDGVEVFNPRMRVKKATRRGVVTFTESVFPNYIFARFELAKLLDRVKYSPSVSTVVHFGLKMPKVPEEVITELQEQFGGEEVVEVDFHVQPGDDVVIGEGPLYGMQGTVLRVLNPHQRVEVLLNMLGRVTPVVISPEFLIPETAF